MAQIWPKFASLSPGKPWDVFDGLDAAITRLLVQNQGPSNIHAADRTSEPTTGDRGIEYPDTGESWEAASTIEFIRPPDGQKLWAWVLNGRARLAYQPTPEG